MKKIKNWFLNHFLPMWAKETVLADNRKLMREVSLLRQELDKQKAYIAGLETGIKHSGVLFLMPGRLKSEYF